MQSENKSRIQHFFRIPLAIYYGFDEHFSILEQKVDYLSECGFSHIQTSPIQNPNGPHEWDSSEWWQAYQPVSYEIGGRYGTEDQFKNFLNKAKSSGMEVIIDIVFNHVGSVYDEWKEKRLSFEDWRHADQQRKNGIPYFWEECLSAVRYRYRHMIWYDNKSFGFDQPEHYRYFTGSFAPWWSDCPALNLENYYVREVQKKYLDKLCDFGIKGFRFDAVEYFPAEAWFDYIYHLGYRCLGSEYAYAECTGGILSGHQKYIQEGYHSMDYILFNEMVKIFHGDGWFCDLRGIATNSDPNSVTFVETHDTAHGRSQSSGIWLGGDDRDRTLAALYIIARRQGVPLIFNESFNKDQRRISDALYFRRKINEHKGPVETIEKSSESCFDFPLEVNLEKDLLILRLGNLGFMIMNKSNVEIDSYFGFSEPYNEMKGRCYLKLGYGETYSIQIDENNHTKSKIVIPPHDAVLYMLDSL